MEKATEKKRVGKVIGHTVRSLPKKVTNRGAGITVTQTEKVRAYVTIQVDHKKSYTVPSRKSEVSVGEYESSEEIKKDVYRMLLEKHPFDAERSFDELIFKRGKGNTFRRYKLDE